MYRHNHVCSVSDTYMGQGIGTRRDHRPQGLLRDAGRGGQLVQELLPGALLQVVVEGDSLVQLHQVV